MLEVYNKDGTQKRIVENDDLTLKTDRNVRVINELPVQVLHLFSSMSIKHYK